MGFGLGVHLESRSWGTVTQGPEQVYLEIYIKLALILSHGGPGLASQGLWPSLPNTQVFQLKVLIVARSGASDLSQIPP